AGAGGGVGPGAPLGASVGSIVELGDTITGDSSFDILFELDLGGGLFAYNQTPLTLTASILCVSPNRIYEHPDGCIPLFDSPGPGGVEVARLVTANHDPFGDPLCPLPTDDFLCVKRQIFDCVGTDQETCLPRIVTNTDGSVEAVECDCFDDSGRCGPVSISADGASFSCTGSCPDPDKCVIHLDGTSTGASDIPVTAVPDGAGVTCDCGVSVEPPIRAPAPHNILKNRYISIDPRGASGNNPSSHHIRVMVSSSLVPDQVGSGPWWAGAPQNGVDLCGTPCLSIVTTTKPAIEPDWSGCPVVHLTGCPIIPTTTYAIATEAGGVLSADASFDTQAKPGVKWHSDCVGIFDGADWTPPNGVTSIDDAVAAIKTFQDCGAINAAHLSRVDLSPNLPGAQINLICNINDVFVVILGFQGFTYPNPNLNTCP
ncbi:MAG: hypothetical protein IH897_15600, partial [Planctomycetes bacterium]|nr:hypothetical protein [Planctomycetota bacterium]